VDCSPRGAPPQSCSTAHHHSATSGVLRKHSSILLISQHGMSRPAHEPLRRRPTTSRPSPSASLLDRTRSCTTHSSTRYYERSAERAQRASRADRREATARSVVCAYVAYLSFSRRAEDARQRLRHSVSALLQVRPACSATGSTRENSRGRIWTMFD
jgi:hypothetical protein